MTDRPILLVLPGITADAAKLATLRYTLEADGRFRVRIPSLRQGLGLAWCARSLSRHLHHHILPEAQGPIHVLAYISGGFILREAARRASLPPFGRILQVRSPLQEQVPVRLRKRHGALKLGLARGRMAVQLGALTLDRLPPLPEAELRALVLERGCSRLARELGLAPDNLDTHWQDLRERLAEQPFDQLHWVDQSHDEIYTDAGFLRNACAFFATGAFPEE